MLRISLLLLALPAVAGCTMLTPSWLPGAARMPTGQTRARPPCRRRPCAKNSRLRPLPRRPRLDNRAMADYLRDLAGAAGLEQSRHYSEARKCYEQLIRTVARAL